MRKIWRVLGILVLVFTLFGFFLFQPGPMAADDPGSKISSSLLKAIKARTTQRQPHVSGTLQEPALDPLNVSVFIYTHSRPDAAQAADMSSLGVTAYTDSWIPPVGAHPQGFITALVPISKVNGLAAKDYVIRLESAEGQSYQMNDVAVTDIKASTFYSGGYTGAGVRVAILDNGLDTTHQDFPAPVFAKDYWNYPAIGDNVTSPNPGGSDHGTHVAGSALGRGTLSGGKYKGIASGAEFVFIKIGNNTTGTASNAAMSNALKDAVDRYGANIISMSYGGWSPHHDGTDANCQAADYAVSKGATVFISAGNEAAKAKHYKGTVAAGATTDYIQVNVISDNCTLEHNLVWYDGLGMHNELTVQYYNAAKGAIPTVYYRMEESARGTERRQFEMTDNTSIIPAGSTYYIKVTNASTADQEFHIYYDGAPSSQVKFDLPEIYYTLGSPGEADNVICVGSYNSRISWTDYTGTVQPTGETLGVVSGFSSRGPRVEAGAPQKPNVVAPGSAIISCRDSSSDLDIYTVSNNGSSGLPANYYVMSGTSMATPVAAGSAALLMQAYPGLKGKPAEVKRLLQPDTTPNNSWGYGLIDLQKTSNKAPQSANVQSSTGQGQVTFSTNAGTIGRLSATGGGPVPQGSGLYTFPFGLFSYDISELSIGETIQVTITLPAAGPTQWMHYNGNGWEQVPVISVNGNIMVIRLTDGGIGDDDAADGDIEDPGGPIVISSSISTKPPSSSATMSSTPLSPPVMLPNVTVQSARLSTTTVTPGTPVTVTADVTNRSTVNGNKRVTLYVNGQVENSQSTTVNSGGSSQLTFSVSRSEPGDYSVYVDGMPAGSFQVEMVTGNDVILICSATLIAMAFLPGMIMLRRRQRNM
jgi:subtilisin family serine protease